MTLSGEADRAVDSGERHVLDGGGAMGALMRTIDWSKTAVGPVERWPQSLRTALSILLDTGFAMYIAWGKDFTQFYNDGYRPILGSTKHPAAMGISTRETFAEIWHIIGPMFEGVMRGTPVTVRDFLLPLDRHGFSEECYFDFSYSPIREESGVVGGVLVTVSETTSRVLDARRLETLRALAARTQKAETALAACELSAEVLSESAADLPFALLYLFDDDRRTATIAAAAGVEARSTLAPRTIATDDASVWPLAELARGGAAQIVDVPHPFVRGDEPPPTKALIVPVRTPGEERASGVLVAATSARLLLDDAYRSFVDLVSGQIGTAIASARSLEEAKARAAALAEIDRAKTAFFGNVSHEFRTPLTLMLGPLEDALATADGTISRATIEMTHRNGVRLLKLVNTLLDFARIEAGRVQASYEPTDLCTLTTDLASVFRSAIERAGLCFEVACEPIDEPVFVDHDMWEKIVLNLLSNALKFTFEGTIAIRLRSREGRAELSVSDTGVGVAENELPRLFERFHRIEGTRSRTHEGSGIGLALVQELVRLHGGDISATSTYGAGTTFRVVIPFGTRHLPAERIIAPRSEPRTTSGARPFVEEALRWLPEGETPANDVREPNSDDEQPSPAAARVLVVDDNADMRDYLRRVLGTRWSVETAPDGLAALDVMRRSPPDVVVTDAMMPNLDGFGLLRAIRTSTSMPRTPVIMLSARAGEEARAEGLEAGADDYLVKPFAARELLARVDAQIVHARLRALEERHSMKLASIFENAPVAIAILRGPDHVFELANAHYLTLVSGRDVLGKPIRQALPELEGQGVFELLDGVYATKKPFVTPSIPAVLNRGPNGAPEEGIFNLVYQPLIESDPQMNGIVVVATEVTALATARREAESANRAKDEFLAMLGHELRNPLAPILTALELMNARGSTESVRERTVIERQVKHVVRLVDDLLDVSRLTRGKVELARARVDLAEVVAKAIEMASPLVEQRRHALRVDVDRAKLVVSGDATRLAQVVTNLLTNAAKYTEPGGRITVTARQDGRYAVVEVADSGIGIAPETLPTVFEPFVQEQQSLDRSAGGLGLGLAIVRNIVQLHGGRVAVHSEGRGRGSRFAVRLPLAASEADAEPAAVRSKEPAAVGGAGHSILVVDDNRDAADMLSDFLSMNGYEVHVAYDAASALALAAKHPPKIALLDIGLPVMDGYELASRLRDLPELAHTKLVAVTGYGQPTDRARARESGFDEHLVKPLDLQVLGTVMERLKEG